MIVVPSRMGRLNRRALFAQLQRAGTASRAELAKVLGMSQPTAGKIVDDLIRLGLVEEVSGGDGGEVLPRAGRPARVLRVGCSAPRFVLIQLGVSVTRVALSAAGVGEDAWGTEFATPGTASGWGEALAKVARELPCAGGWGVLVSVPGIVEERTGRVHFSPNLHWTEKADVGALAGRAWKLPVALVQEERALALGHQVFDRGGEDFLLVDFGDGLGGAAVVQGKLYENPLPLSGELGHTPVLRNRRPCGCGAVGCVETLVSTRGLLESFGRGRGARGERTWADLVGHVARRGVPAWLGASLDAAAMAIAGALNVLGLRRVVVTGTPAELGPAVMRHLAGAVVRGAMWARFGQVECVAAPRRRMAGLAVAGIDRLVLGGPGDHERTVVKPTAER